MKFLTIVGRDGQVVQFRENKKGQVCAIFRLTNFQIYDIIEVWAAPGVRGALKARASFSTGLFCQIINFRKGVDIFAVQ